jgi:hypothetical protein
MKQIFKNSYIKVFSFTSSQEASAFANNQGTKKVLYIDDTFGDNYYCYVICHSLTKEKQFVLLFSSYENEDNLNFLYWDGLLVLDTGKNILLIDESLNIKASIEVYICLIGLYLINKEKLLVLEEASYKIINSTGEVLKSESLDLIEDFSLKDNLLLIKTSEENKVIELI